MFFCFFFNHNMLPFVSQSKIRGTALVEQDKVLAEKTSQVSQLSEQLQSTTSRLSQLTLERDQLQKQLHESTEKIQEQEKTLHTNENGC